MLNYRKQFIYGLLELIVLFSLIILLFIMIFNKMLNIKTSYYNFNKQKITNLYK